MAQTALAFAIDDAYVMPFEVFFYTLEKTKSIPSCTKIFILHTETLSLRSIARVKRFLSRYQRDPQFLDSTHLIPDNLPIKAADHVSKATFYRLFIAAILPSDIDQVVYLDVDMIAIRSLRSLFSFRVRGLLAAVDHCSPSDSIRLWGPCGGNYFQAGLLVIPLATWRKDCIHERFIEIMSSASSQIRWWDQDILNLAIPNNWDRLDIWLNVCDKVWQVIPNNQIIQHGALIHFCGHEKPWNSFAASPFNHFWDNAYEELYHTPFDRSTFLPPFPKRLKLALKSRLIRFIRSI